MPENDVIVGMKAICDLLGRSEGTILRVFVPDGLPIRQRKKGGVWTGSRRRILDWWYAYNAPNAGAGD